MTQLVACSTRDGIAVITIDNPPVNALSPGVPEGMLTALETAERDPSVRAIVMICAGRTFISGADIIALRKVEIESTDYAFREYGVSPAELQAFDKAAEQRYRKMKRSGKLKSKTPQQLRRMIEKATVD